MQLDEKDAAPQFQLASTVLQPEDNTQGQPLLDRHTVTRCRPQVPVRPGFSHCRFVQNRPAAGLRDLDIQYSSIRADEYRERFLCSAQVSGTPTETGRKNLRPV